MSIKDIVNSDAQKARHLQQATQIETTANDIHEAACENLMHVIRKGNGDLSLCKHQCEALGLATKGKSSAPLRVEALKFWYLKMSGNQIKVVDGNWKLVKGWSKDKFASEATMEKTTFNKLTTETAPQDMNWGSILKRLQGLVKQIDRAVDEGHFKGDPEKVKSIVSNVVDFAAVAGKKLSAQEAGETLKAVNIEEMKAMIDPADPKGQSRSAVAAAKSADREREFASPQVPETEPEVVAA